MYYKLTKISWILFFLLSIFPLGCSQQKMAFKTVEQKTHSAVTPVPKTEKWWTDRHQKILDSIKQGKVDLIFVGDSITHHWEDKGSQVWQKYYGSRNAVNMGIKADRTQHLLWRLDHSDLEQTSPKVTVLLIGTNNHPPRNTKEEVCDGIIAVCAKLREKLPNTKILLLAIFPRKQKPCEMREELAFVSKTVSKIADNKTIFYLDIGDKFLEPDGTLSPDIMPDYLHPNEKGYEIWAQAMEPKLAKLLNEK